MTKFISLGSSCCVKHHIDLFCGKSATLPFDWVVIDFKSVLDLISCSNPENVFSIDNLVNSSKINPDLKYVYSIKNLSLYEFYHDLKEGSSKEDIINFTQKYQRRYHRLIDIISTVNDICFIHHGSYNQNDIDEFCEKIRLINPKLDFKVIIIDKENSVNNYSCDHTICVRENSFIKSQPSQDEHWWKFNHIDWVKIFNLYSK
jgi:hypothetical protein